MDLATLLQDELRVAHEKIDGLADTDLPPTFSRDQWRLLAVVEDYATDKRRTKTVSDLVPVFQALAVAVEAHLDLLDAVPAPPTEE